jgi:succinoglycan biosynthesis protein ExoA
MLVSIITPCRNEVEFIANFVESALLQKLAEFSLEIIIAEGESNDGTQERLADLCGKYKELRVISNTARIVSTGLNKAIEVAHGDIIVRMDVHTVYEQDYVAECVTALKASGAACVGGPWRAEGRGSKQQAIADAFQSPIGSGGAASRRLDYDGPCETVYLGCWWKNDIVAIGGFDENLVRNQDDELCFRFKLANKNIWQSSSIRSCYQPRASFQALWKQFFQYGYWKVAVAKKHNQHASPRHLVPFLFVSVLGVLLLAGLFSAFARQLLAAATVLYLLAVITGAASASRSKNFLAITYVAFAISCMHFSYGIGYGLGLKDFRLGRGQARSSMFSLTR